MADTCCRIADLRNKEVINVCDGARLGFVYDVEIDVCCGRVVAIIVPGESKCFSFGFGRTPDIRIPWDKIEHIGADVILVSGNFPRFEKEKC